METNPKPEEKEALEFKGLYIDRFLQIEYVIEQIIIRFFQEHEHERGGLLAIENQYIRERNEKINTFFDHFLFLEQPFSTNLKLESVKAILQIDHGNLFDAFSKPIQKNYPNIFSLFLDLMKFRNLLAHNTSVPFENQIVTFKKSKKFKSIQTKEKKDGEKTIVKDNWDFHPQIELYVISNETRNELFEQLKLTRVFFLLVLDFFIPEGEKVIKDDTERAKKFVAITESNFLLPDKGVFAINKNIKKFATREKP